MGGSKNLKAKIRFRKFHKKVKVEELDIPKEQPKEEDVNALLDLWKKNKKEEKGK